MAEDALQKQREYYKSKEEEFLKNCYGKYVVINDKLEVYVMDTIGDAHKLGCAAFGYGNFFLHQCVEQKTVYIGGVGKEYLDSLEVIKTETGYKFKQRKKEAANG